MFGSLKLYLILGAVLAFLGMGGVIYWLYLEQIKAAEHRGSLAASMVINQEALNSLRQQIEIQNDLNDKFQKDIQSIRRKANDNSRFLNSQEFRELSRNNPTEAIIQLNRRTDNLLKILQQLSNDITGTEELINVTPE